MQAILCGLMVIHRSLQLICDLLNLSLISLVLFGQLLNFAGQLLDIIVFHINFLFEC